MLFSSADRQASAGEELDGDLVPLVTFSVRLAAGKQNPKTRQQMIQLTKFGTFNPAQTVFVNPLNIKTAERQPMPNAPTVITLMDGSTVFVNELPQRVKAQMQGWAAKQGA